MANEATMSASEVVAEPSITPSETNNTPAPLKKILLDINGQQHEMSADEFEKERRKVQLHKASTIKFQEAADKEKFAKEVLSLFSKDNFSGKSLKEVAKRNNLSNEELMLAVEELM